MKIKRFITAAISVFMILSSVLSLAGCSLFSRKSYVWGDFKYEIWGKEDKWITIIDFSDAGKEKEVIIMPKEIDGIKVTNIGCDRSWFTGRDTLQSQKLESIYFMDNACQIARSAFVNNDSEPINECPNLKSAFVINANMDYYRLEIAFIEPFSERSTYGAYVYIYSDTYFVEYETYQSVYNSYLPANITYYYNYEEAENSGVYWLDNLADGEKITYIPQNPEREGYTFGGWYREPECINKWDFESDTIISTWQYKELESSESLLNQYKYAPTEQDFYENKLYAKWL